MSKDESKRADTNAVKLIKVYSDGSAHRGKVGTAAILRQEGSPDRFLTLHLGTTAQHTVYEAELVGMILGLHLIKTERRNTVRCILNVDNQAVLVAIKSKMSKSGQHLAANLHQIANKLHESKGNNRFRLTFCWTAGHVRIDGNEEADKLAKGAADGESSAKEALPVCLRKKIGYSLSAVRQAHNERLKRKWVASWTSSPRYLRSQYQDLLTPYSQKYLKYISQEGVSRRTASLIFQLWVGHAPINQYLHRFKKIDSLQCPACGHHSETTEHFILQCPKFEYECWPLLGLVKSRHPSLTRILACPKLLMPLANYIEAIGRFQANVTNPTVSTATQEQDNLRFDITQ